MYASYTCHFTELNEEPNVRLKLILYSLVRITHSWQWQWHLTLDYVSTEVWLNETLSMNKSIMATMTHITSGQTNTHIIHDAINIQTYIYEIQNNICKQDNETFLKQNTNVYQTFVFMNKIISDEYVFVWFVFAG